MKIKESNITINVQSLDKSVAFYESLGLTLKERWNDHYAQLKGPDIVIGLHPTKKPNLSGNSGNVSIGFTTDDFEGAKLALIQLGIDVHERKEEGGEFLHFSDPDRTSLYVIKPKW